PERVLRRRVGAALSRAKRADAPGRGHGGRAVRQAAVLLGRVRAARAVPPGGAALPPGPGVDPRRVDRGRRMRRGDGPPARRRVRPRQRVADLPDAVVGMTPGSGSGPGPRLAERDARAIADIERLRFFPLTAVGGEGSWLIAEDGRRLLD